MRSVFSWDHKPPTLARTLALEVTWAPSRHVGRWSTVQAGVILRGVCASDAVTDIIVSSSPLICLVLLVILGSRYVFVRVRAPIPPILPLFSVVCAVFVFVSFLCHGRRCLSLLLRATCRHVRVHVRVSLRMNACRFVYRPIGPNSWAR
jgi:hypothetical protein